MKKFPLFIFILCAACSMWTCTEREDPLKNIGIDRESIVNIEEMTLYVASVKMYPYTDREISEDDLYNKYRRDVLSSNMPSTSIGNLANLRFTIFRTRKDMNINFGG